MSYSTLDTYLAQIKTYSQPQRVKTDVSEATVKFSGLIPKIGLSTKGTQVIVLMGTIPIYFQNVQYNIPLNLWVVDTYPLTAPMCVLNPTPDMIIKPKHTNVDAQGICYHPYLTNWNANSSSLVPLLTALSQTFSIDPPLRSKPPSNPPTSFTPAPTTTSTPVVNPTSFPATNYPVKPTATPVNTNPIPVKGSNAPTYPPNAMYGGNPPYGTSSPYPPSSNPSPIPPTNMAIPSVSYGTGYPSNSPYPPNPNANPPSYGYGQPQPTTMMEDPAIVMKRNAIAAATERLKTKFQAFHSETQAEVDKLLSSNADLDSNLKSLGAIKSQTEVEKLNLDSDSEQLTKAISDLNLWLEKNASSSQDIDAITESKTPLDKQLFALTAEDFALEDMLYFLEKKLNAGGIDLETFLKTYRALCSDQFQKRALCGKVLDAQRSSHSQSLPQKLL